MEIEAFIERWSDSGGAERANFSPFLSELCDALGVARPEPATGGGGTYRFERSVVRHEKDGSTSTRRIDLYRQGCFVMEAKQGKNEPVRSDLFEPTEAEKRAAVRQSKGWAQAMLAAKGQAEGYARDLPEEWPPFLIVCDVGFCFDVYPKVNKSADLALFFWWKAAEAVAAGKVRRFGFITSNSLRQVFCRRVVAAAMAGRVPVRLVFAVPDHPWTDGSGSAAVRIAMSVGEAESKRPAYQAPLEAARRGQQQGTLAVDQDVVLAERRWPKAEPEQFLALRGALRAGPAEAREIARHFKGAPRGDRVTRMLETLTALGQAQRLDGGRFSA